MRPLGDVWHSHLDQGRLSLIRQPYKGRPKNSLISSLINNCLRDQCRSPWKDVLVRYRLELQPKSQQLILPNTGPQFLLEHKGDQRDSMMPFRALDGDFQIQQDMAAFRRKEWWEGRTTQLVFMTEILKKPEVLTTILVNWKHTWVLDNQNCCFHLNLRTIRSDGLNYAARLHTKQYAPIKFVQSWLGLWDNIIQLRVAGQETVYVVAATVVCRCWYKLCSISCSLNLFGTSLPYNDLGFCILSKSSNVFTFGAYP